LESFSFALGRELRDVEVADVGDLELPAELEPALARIERVVDEASSAGRLPVLVGGEHTVSLAAVRAVRRTHADLMLLHVDAHADLRAEYEGEVLSRATWIVHSGLPLELVVQVGVRSSGAEELQARRRTAHSTTELDFPHALLADKPVYLSLDVDVLDPGAAPGVLCPEPGGPSVAELLAFVHSLQPLHVVGVDVVEVAPDVDAAGITALAAAKLLRELILLFA
jgi:agmatinase